MDRLVRNRENRLRRLAAKHELSLTKSRSRDPSAIDYGLYGLKCWYTTGMVNEIIAGYWVHSWTLDEVEEYLKA